MSTAIQWTDVTDNIIVAKGGGWWCRKISPGCANCYADKLNQNDFFGGNHLPYTGDPPELELRLKVLAGWQRQRKPKKHFVASMTDVFGEWVPRPWQMQMLDAMAAAPRQTFQVLTKRAAVMRQAVAAWLAGKSLERVPDHIWLGVSVENNDCLKRVDELMQIPAVRFLSCEPLLEHLEFCGCWLAINAGPNFECKKCGKRRLLVDWVIVGGESGDKARGCNVDWIASVVKHCAAAGVACFVKQLGQKPFNQEIRQNADGEDASVVSWDLKLKDSHGGDMAEWPEELRVREFPND